MGDHVGGRATMWAGRRPRGRECGMLVRLAWGGQALRQLTITVCGRRAEGDARESNRGASEFRAIKTQGASHMHHLAVRVSGVRARHIAEELHELGVVVWHL